MSYSSEVLSDSPHLYWRLGEATEGTVQDATANNRDGTIAGTNGLTVGVTGLISGDSDTAYQFSGAGTSPKYVEIATPGTGTSPTDVAIEWVAQTSQNTGTVWLAGRLGSYCLFMVDGVPSFRTQRTTGSQFTATSSVSIADGVKHHVIGRIVSNTLTIWVDGVQVGSAAAAGTLRHANAFRVGWESDHAQFNGVMDEVTLYVTNVPSDTRIGVHAAAVGGGTPPPSVSLAGQVPAVTSAFSLTYTPPPATLSLAGEVPGVAGAFTIVGDIPAVLVDLAGTIPGVVGDFSADVVPIGVTDTSNRVGGRVRSGYGIATWSPAVVAPPAGTQGGRDVFAVARGAVVMQGTQPTFTETIAREPAHLDRVVVGGVDVTRFRADQPGDQPTPLPSYLLVQPLLYADATLTFPQIVAWAETTGVGELKWLKIGKKVLVQRVDEAGNVVATDYKGVILAIDKSGDDLTVEVGGEAAGRATLRDKQLPLFSAKWDIGRLAWAAVKDLGLPFSPRVGPTTGIEVAKFGGTGWLDYISELCAKAWTRAGNQWTIMPSTDGVYRMARKDTTTIHGTVYLDGARTVGDLRRDIAEEPNRIFVTCVTPEGMRVRFGVYPGLKQGDPADYPFNDNRNFSAGTTDADTDTGDGVTVMIFHLSVTGYLDVPDQPGGYDADVTKAIRELQDDVDLPVTGTMTPATWRRLFDLDATGFSLRGSQIEPAAQKSKTRKWIRSGSGAIVARNPNYDPTVLPRDRTIDMGTGITKSQAREFARALLDQSEDNWVGTITFHTGALVAGDHTPGDPIASLLRARDLRPGMNLSLPQFEGGIVVHVSGISVSEDGTVQATVDTRARDAMEVWEVIQRNKESRRSPYRQWKRAHRSSGVTKDGVTEFDEVGGILGDNITLSAHRWRGNIQIVAAQAGTIAQLITKTNPNAEYVLIVSARPISSKRLAHMIGNPLSKAGGKRWEDESVRERLTDRYLMLYVAGSNEQPLGYFPKDKRPDTVITNEVNPDYDPTADADNTGTDDEPTIEVETETGSITPLTGRWEDDAGFGYFTDQARVLYVAVYADRDTVIPAGRIMKVQLEPGA